MRQTAVLIGLVLGCLITGTEHLDASDSDKDEAVRQDRKLYEGTWRVTALQADGKPAPGDDAKKITVVNLADGTWSVLVDGKEIAKGISQIDPTKSPKTIDFTPTEGFEKAKVYLGIYSIETNTRKLCFAPPRKDRPTVFSSTPGSGLVLVEFQREPR